MKKENVAENENIALESRGKVILKNVQPLQSEVVDCGSDFIYKIGALMRANQMAGALESILEQSVRYANERIQFGRPIGKNQGIQHPLADTWMKLEAANLMVFEAARLFDSGKLCGAEANAAKYLGAEAAHDSCERAILTHGGMGYAKEYHVERYLRESYIARIAPVSREMILNYISERVLGLPRSY